MEMQNLNISDSKSLSEVSFFDINEDNFNNIVEIIKNALKLLEIKIDNMLIFYQRQSDKSSMLAIKLSQGNDDDIDNYMFYGCRVDDYNLCDIYMHAESKSAQKAAQVQNLISNYIITFFESVELDLSKKNLSDLEISFKIPLCENMSQDIQREKGSIRQLIKSIFK